MMRFAAVGLGLFAQAASGAVFEGSVESSVGFAFLSKFCFDVAKQPDQALGRSGELTITLSMADGGNLPTGLEILVYDDEDKGQHGSWLNVYPAVEEGDLECLQAAAQAKNSPTPANPSLKPTQVTSGVPTWTMGAKEVQIVQYSRPRFWYAVVSSCGKALPKLNYKVTMTQLTKETDPTYGMGWWSVQFSFNDIGLNSLYLVMFFPVTIGMIVEAISVLKLKKKMKFVHPLVRLFFAAVVLQFIIVLFKMLHFGIYPNDGVGLPALSTIGDFMDIIKKGVFLLVIMLLAKGWTISTEELTGKKLVLAAVAGFMVFDLIIYIWETLALNPAQTSLSASSFFLYIASAAWFFFGAWFAYLVLKSYKAEDNPVKKSLFLKLGLFYFPWVFGLPFVYFLTLILDPWVRDITIASVELVLTLAGYTFLGYILWPSRAEEYFNISTPNVQTTGVDHYDQL